MHLPKFKAGDLIRSIYTYVIYEVILYKPAEQKYIIKQFSATIGVEHEVSTTSLEPNYDLVGKTNLSISGSNQPCPVVAMQQTNLAPPPKPKGPKFKLGDKIRSIHYPEVIREVLGVLPATKQYIIQPYISGQDKSGYVDMDHLEFLYEKCGIPEEIPVLKDYCHHEWKSYVGITNWYDYCAVCGERRKSQD